MINIKAIRTIQIAAIMLKRLFPAIELKVVDGDLYNILVSSDDEDKLRFGVNVVSSSYLDSMAYNQYFNRLTQIDSLLEVNRLPILVMAVNESSETAMIGMQIGWKLGRPIFFKRPGMVSVTRHNMVKIIDLIKSMDETIRILSRNGIKVVKTIALARNDCNGFEHHAQMVYLRDFTEDYNMKYKVVINEKVKFQRLFSGIPEDEYPNDLLDNAIMEMVKQEFPNAVFSSKMMLFSTDLCDLRALSKFVNIQSSIAIEPDFTRFPNEIISNLGGVEMVRFNIDVFVDLSCSRSLFENMSFCKIEKVGSWLNNYSNYSRMISSLHSPKEFFI